MKETQKKHITHNPQPKTEVTTPIKASRKRLAPEVASPTAAGSTPAVKLVGDLPNLGGTAPVPGVTPVPSSSAPVPAASSSTTTTVPTAPTVPGVEDGPPALTFPDVPEGYSPPLARSFAGRRISKGQLAAMPKVLKDLGALASVYTTLFGSSAPDPTTLASQATLGIKWRKMRNQSESWTGYVQSADAAAWKPVLSGLDLLKPLFLVALERNATIAVTYPGLTEYFELPEARAKAAFAARKKNAKAKTVAKSAVAEATTSTAAADPEQPSAAKVTINT